MLFISQRGRNFPDFQLKVIYYQYPYNIKS